jgi:hydroxymethylbilane synthase
MGGCSTPISGFARVDGSNIIFDGNILSTDGKLRKDVTKKALLSDAANLGQEAAKVLLEDGGQTILKMIQDGK